MYSTVLTIKLGLTPCVEGRLKGELDTTDHADLRLAANRVLQPPVDGAQRHEVQVVGDGDAPLRDVEAHVDGARVAVHQLGRDPDLPLRHVPQVDQDQRREWPRGDSNLGKENELLLTLTISLSITLSLGNNYFN